MAPRGGHSFLRGLLKISLLIGLLGAFGAALAYLYPPGKAGPFEELMEIGKAAEVPPGAGKLVWFKGRPVWVLHLEKGFVALAARCPHGCLLDWDGRRRVLVDPCHGGTFDTNGNPLTGWHSTPLTRFEAKVIGDEIYLRRPR